MLKMYKVHCKADQLHAPYLGGECGQHQQTVRGRRLESEPKRSGFLQSARVELHIALSVEPGSLHQLAANDTG